MYSEHGACCLIIVYTNMLLYALSIDSDALSKIVHETIENVENRPRRAAEWSVVDIFMSRVNNF